jgi:hypothetical protein
MKKRYSIIFTITAAAVLVSSIAYASRKKLHPKSELNKQDISEVDLMANLSDASGNSNDKPIVHKKVTHPQKIDNNDDAKLKELTMVDQYKSPEMKLADELQSK